MNENEYWIPLFGPYYSNSQIVRIIRTNIDLSSLSQIWSLYFSSSLSNCLYLQFSFLSSRMHKTSAHTHRRSSHIDSPRAPVRVRSFTEEFLLLSGAYCNRGIIVSRWFNNFYHSRRFIFSVLIKRLKVRNTYIDRVYSKKQTYFTPF